MKNLSKKIAGLAAAVTLGVGGVTQVQGGMKVVPVFDYEELTKIELSDNSSEALYNIVSEAEDYVENHLSDKEQSEIDGVHKFAQNYTGAIGKMSFNEFMNDPQMAKACLIISAFQMHSELTQKRSDEELDAHYYLQLNAVEAISRGQDSYSTSMMAGMPGEKYIPIKDPVAELTRIKSEMAFDFMIEKIGMEKNESLVQNIRAMGTLIKALNDGQMSEEIFKNAQKEILTAQETIQKIDEKYLSDGAVKTQLNEQEPTLAQMPQKNKMIEAVKAIYIKEGIKMTNDYIQGYFKRSGIEISPSQQEITPQQAVRAILKAQKPDYPNEGPRMYGYPNSASHYYRGIGR